MLLQIQFIHYVLTIFEYLNSQLVEDKYCIFFHCKRAVSSN